MMTSSNVNIFRVTGSVVRGIHPSLGVPLEKASDVEVDVFFDLRLTDGWANNQDTGDWYAMALIMTSL